MTSRAEPLSYYKTTMIFKTWRGRFRPRQATSQFTVHRFVAQLTISQGNCFPPHRVSLISLELSAVIVNSVVARAWEFRDIAGHRINRAELILAERRQFIRIRNYAHWRSRGTEPSNRPTDRICIQKLLSRRLAAQFAKKSAVQSRVRHHERISIALPSHVQARMLSYVRIAYNIK